ncbi:MAG: dimethylsulfonioproprionate lyase family protein [Pseudomonadota bacterium]
MSLREADEALLSAIQAFVAGSNDPEIGRFRAGIQDWGEDWAPADPVQLPAADTLSTTLHSGTGETRPLMAAFEEHKVSRKWEQSYSRADNVVGDDMLAGYGFAEVIGKHGPFVSERVRSGIGVWGPGIDYPSHRHAAEEVYVILGGAAEFRMDEEPASETFVKRAGESVYVRSMRTHAFRTLAEPLCVFYIWQAGDLREKSSFSASVS